MIFVSRAISVEKSNYNLSGGGKALYGPQGQTSDVQCIYKVALSCRLKINIGEIIRFYFFCFDGGEGRGVQVQSIYLRSYCAITAIWDN